MPPYLSIPHYHLSKLPITTKIALTGFTLLLLFAIGFVVFSYFPERTKFTTEGVKDNFAGNEWRQERGEVVEQERAKPSERQIYDIVHPHSFMMAVIYFILCHMMEMCYAPRWLKIGLYVVAFVSLAAVLVAPLLVWNKLAWAPIVAPSVVVLMATFAVMAITPTVQMWVVGPRTTDHGPR
jgi:hypothetical protein